MGTQDNQPDRTNANETATPQQNLQAINAQLEYLKNQVLRQLNQDINQLETRKNRLLQETEQLEFRRQQQEQQQQDLVQQIAPALAQQLHYLLQQQLNSGSAYPTTYSVEQINDYSENANRAIASLDTTLRTTFRTLQQDLSSYQSSLSQQLGQMYSLEQQGTAILDALVTRLKAELEAKMAEPVSVTPPPPAIPAAPSPRPVQNAVPAAVEAPPTPPPAPSAPKPQKKRPQPSQVKLGFIMILLYSLTLSLQNVVTRVIVKPEPSDIFGGILRLGSYIAPSFGNAVLLLMLRMIFVVVVMSVLAGFLYPNTWQDIKQFVQSKNTGLWLKVVGSGFFLFLSQVLIYIAFGLLSAGVAITIFFIFPIVTVLLSWLIFGEKPSLIRSAATGVVFLGVAIIALFGGGSQVGNISLPGIAIAAASGITFALYVLLIQAGAKVIHPIPLSAINFATILLFSILSFLMPFTQSSVSINPDLKIEIVMCGLVLGGISLFSYLVNNIGISLIGAARASIFGATGPVFTALLTFLIVGEALSFPEVLGMLIVTVGVAAVSAERLLKKPQSQVQKR
ncbi:MAG: DMT family transporter [Jaaginema sp. PMC 1079.18]|nr:DMT family transporter [Jaaginema sp. PMC 1080.18]MEC4849696.1 DMT family transporter [Jaaginema sp. PMC 1079.18]MEC4864875.1 DMT family transporter [Jaaginema sp. PMC 1078.18]